MQLHINPHDQAPVYRQIQHQIASAIAERQIRPGHELESQKELAVQLAVSPTAVRKAYRELQSQGLCAESLDGRFRVAHPGLPAGHADRTELALSLLKRELLTEELRAAREIQGRLLPPASIRGDSWVLEGRSFPCGSLAGDFYDLVEHADGRLDVVVADVAGKGLGAGLIMASAKALVPLVAAAESPAEALERLNERLLPLLGQREFVALAYARLDPRRGTLTIANAGLPDPYLLRVTGDVEMCDCPGDRLPLGVRADVSYSNAPCTLGPNDRLLILTDGIPETIDVTGNPFGYDGLLQLLESMNHPAADRQPQAPDRWLDRFLERVGHRTGSLPDDDWTALLLEHHGPEGKGSCRS
jgi:sigma-B regulation protein RsbU (phosphoserine phosphatase)